MSNVKIYANKSKKGKSPQLPPTIDLHLVSCEAWRGPLVYINKEELYVFILFSILNMSFTYFGRVGRAEHEYDIR